MMVKKRAVNAEQQQLRRQQILAVAKQMILAHHYHEINLNDIAIKLNLSKPALYRYFNGKEVLFLQLYLEQFTCFLRAFEQQPQLNDQQLAAYIAEYLDKNKALAQLSSILHTILEHTQQFEDAKQFKLSLKELTERLVARLSDVNNRAVEDSFNCVIKIQMLLIGAWQVSHPSSIMTQVLADEALALFRIDFKSYFLNLCQAILQR